jgi:hypothetical protein
VKTKVGLKWLQYWVYAGDYGAGHHFECLHRLILNIFPFQVSTAKLIGDFYNNTPNTVNRCPRFAYSFVSLMLCRTIGAANFTPRIGESQRIKKTHENSLILPASPVGAASAPRFAYMCRVQCSVNNISCHLYIALILLVLHFS